MSLQSGSAARFANIGYLIEPKSVAIVGASADATRIGGRPINWMLKAGFGGAIYPVNPNRSEIQGLRAYELVLKLPEAPDAAVVAVPAALVLETMEQLGARGTRAAIVFPPASPRWTATAFAPRPTCRHRQTLRHARCSARIRSASSTARSASTDLHHVLRNGWPRNGGIGIVSQSGAFGKPSGNAGAQPPDSARRCAS